MLKVQQKKTGIKYQFGVKVPRTSREKLDLDTIEGTTYWSHAMKKGEI